MCAQIVRLLFFDPARELYVPELTRESTLALRTVQKELARLSAINLVLSRSNGFHRFCRANRRHPAFAALQQLVIKDRRQSAFMNRHKRPRSGRRRRIFKKWPEFPATILSSAGFSRRIL